MKYIPLIPLCVAIFQLCFSPNILAASEVDLFFDPFDHCKEELLPGYNKPANIDVCSKEEKLFSSFSFLYLEAAEDGLEIGFFNPDSEELFSANNPNGSFIKTPFSFSPGFRMAIGTHIDEDDWDFSAQYTWFHKTTKKEASAPQNASIEPLWLYDISASTPARGLSSKWRLTVDLLDAEMGKSYYLSTENIVRPFWGARIAWIAQKFSPSYQIAGQNISSKNQIRSWGAGLRTGLNTNWMIGGGFTLLANMSTSVLFTHYKVKTSQQSIANPRETALSASETPDYVRAETSGAMGLSWGSYLFNSLLHVNISALYELQTFWKQNLFGASFGGIANRSAKGSSDLHLHGLNLTMRLDF